MKGATHRLCVLLVICLCFHVPFKTFAESKPNQPEKESVIETIKVTAKDKEGKREININMPLKDALPVLKAAYLVGDARFKYQVMANGFMKYRGTLLEEDVTSFLSDQFSREISPIKFNLVFCLFIINPYSPKTAEVLQRATKIVGESKEEILIRELASDFLKYLETDDASILAKYNFLPNELPKRHGNKIGAASQPPTNQTAVVIPESGKTNDLGNSVKP